MKRLLFCFLPVLLSWTNPINWREVVNDFDRPFNNARFCKNVLFIRKDFQDKLFDRTTLVTTGAKKGAWSKINSVMGRCDYIVVKDSGAVNCFFIYSDKAYPKFWIKYDSNKVAVIKIIKPAIARHLIPPPCGY